MRGIRLLLALVPLGVVACTPIDVKDDSGAVGNTAPALTVDVPVAGSYVEVGQPLEVRGFVVDDRDAATDLTVRFFGDVSGELGAARPAVDGSWNRSVTFAGPDTKIIVTAQDRDGGESTVEVALNVYDPAVNNPPNAAEIHIEPREPVTGDFLFVSVDRDAVDPDGRRVTYKTTWDVDGTLYEGDALPQNVIFRGQTVSVSVIANDGVLDGPAATASVIVGNAAPAGGRARIGPDGAVVSNDLWCSLEGVRDREMDSLLLSYSWTVAGVPAGTEEILRAGSAREGEDILCTVFADDGFTVSSFTSEVFQIGNSAPTMPIVNVLPGAPTDTDDLLCEVTTESADPDGDPLRYEVAWYRNGDYTGLSDALLPASETMRDDSWTCEVVATDIRGLSGPPGRASVRILPAWDGTASADEAWATIDGEIASGAFGKSVAIVGDVDGDGASDLIVGASGEGGGAGAMYLFSGAMLGGASTTADAMASWHGGWPTGSLGGYRALTAPGDLDGDGFADLVFAAPEADANGVHSGELYVVYGGPSLGTGLDPSASAEWRMYASANDFLGARVTTGDLNGDGVTDMAVSAPGTSGSARGSGAVHILVGTPGRLSGTEGLSAVDRSVYGDAELDALGWTLRYVGDVTGDGYGDLFTTSMYADVGGSETGTGALLEGASSLTGTGLVGRLAASMFYGAAAGDRMGYDVSGPIDIDADGNLDLVMGAYLSDTGGADAGEIFVYRGRSSWARSYQPSDADAVIVGEVANGRFGHAFGTPGDLDSDGVDDLVIGAGIAPVDGLTGQGAAYVLLGQDWSRYSTSGAIWRSAGLATDDKYGDAVSLGEGDLDGDGRPDFAIGAQGVDAGASDAGRVYVWRGR